MKAAIQSERNSGSRSGPQAGVTTWLRELLLLEGAILVGAELAVVAMQG